MPKEEWGTKRLCPHCNTRFLRPEQRPDDLPGLRAEFTVESLTSGRARSLISEKTAEAMTDQDDDLVDDEDLDDDADRRSGRRSAG
jgi:hypothetical protein